LSGVIVIPSALIEDEYLQSQKVEIKLGILRKHTKGCEELASSGLEQKKLLNQAITFLVFSAFFLLLMAF
jgi:hypothetical protein